MADEKAGSKGGGSGTTIEKCGNCRPHEFQDKTHGDMIRVKNNRHGGAPVCTVCGK